MYPQWTQFELDVLEANINVIPYAELATLLHRRTVDAIKRRATLLGLEKSGKRFPKREVNDYFFYEPSLLSCYWAGVIAADGCVRRVPRTELIIGLHGRDLEHLRRFCADVGFDGQIAITSKNIAVARICAAYRLVDDLERIFRIVPRKTLTLEPPLVTGDLALAYSIGYIDGDGCWATADKNRNLRLIVVGTRSLLEWMVSLWSDHGANIGSPALSFKRNVWRLTLTCAKAERVASLLNNFELPRLERKWRVARREATGQEVQRKS